MAGKELRFNVHVNPPSDGVFTAFTNPPEYLEDLRQVIDGLIAQGALDKASQSRRNKVAFRLGARTLQQIGHLDLSDLQNWLEAYFQNRYLDI